MLHMSNLYCSTIAISAVTCCHKAAKVFYHQASGYTVLHLLPPFSEGMCSVGWLTCGNTAICAPTSCLKIFHVCLQIAEQARIIVAQEQKYSKDIAAMSAQLMHFSAVAGIQSFSPTDLADDADNDTDDDHAYNATSNGHA